MWLGNAVLQVVYNCSPAGVKPLIEDGKDEKIVPI